MTRTLVAFAVACSLMIAAEPVLFDHSATVHAEDNWKAEFADICAKTADVVSIPRAEFQALIDRCDKLKPRIEQLDESTAKVYLRRLQMCRELFVFMRDSESR